MLTDGHFAHLFVGCKLKPARLRRLPIPKRSERGIYGGFRVRRDTNALTIQPAELGLWAEAHGFESVWFGEHSHIPTSRKTPFVMGGELPEYYKQFILRSVHRRTRTGWRAGRRMLSAPLDRLHEVPSSRSVFLSSRSNLLSSFRVPIPPEDCSGQKCGAPQRNPGIALFNPVHVSFRRRTYPRRHHETARASDRHWRTARRPPARPVAGRPLRACRLPTNVST